MCAHPASFVSCSGSERLTILYEQWVSCSGHWRESQFFLRMSTSSRRKKFGCRKWLTQHELAIKYGSAEIAQSIVDAKESDDKLRLSHIRSHPDCKEPWLIGVHASFLTMCS